MEDFKAEQNTKMANLASGLLGENSGLKAEDNKISLDVGQGLKIGENGKIQYDPGVGALTGGGTYFYDGPIDFGDEEQVSQILTGKPEGALVAFDCCPELDCPTGDDPVYINGLYNTREIITESCEWEVPVTGWYKITLIGGGYGAYVYKYGNRFGVSSGVSGAIKTAFIKLIKGQKVPVSIGAGGIGVFSKTDDFNQATRQLTFGGNTTFDNLTTEGSFAFELDVNLVENQTVYESTAYAAYKDYFGAGGMSRVTSGDQQAGNFATDGEAGCAIVEYYDASKDKNINIDMASSVTIRELQQQLTALSARVQELENNE